MQGGSRGLSLCWGEGKEACSGEHGSRSELHKTLSFFWLLE